MIEQVLTTLVNNRAPDGCVQYFVGTSGSLRSYNNQEGNQLSAQFYNLCIRQEEGKKRYTVFRVQIPFYLLCLMTILGFCQVEYRTSGDANTMPDPFNLQKTIAVNNGNTVVVILILNIRQIVN